MVFDVGCSSRVWTSRRSRVLSRMATSDEDDEIIVAVKSDNVLKVTELLAAGCSANVFEPDFSRDSLLHFVRSVDVAKVLLLHGACVNALNKRLETPLHTAVRARHLEIVKFLLKHGASVDCQNVDEDTALTLAVKKRFFNSRVIAELIRYGANVDQRLDHDEYSPLGYSVKGGFNFNVLVKFTILYGVDGQFWNAIDLTPYNDLKYYDTCLQYIYDCVNEVYKLKAQNVGNVSLYKLLTTDIERVVAVYPDNELTKKYAETTFSVYSDVVEEKMAVCLKRGELLHALRETEVYTISQSSEGVAEKVILIFDTLNIIAKYLTNDDISNLVTAFEV